MSITEQQFDDAKRDFVRILPDVEQAQQALKAVKKIQTGLRKSIYQYMQENGIDDLDVGGMQFTIQTKERVQVTQEDLAQLLDEDTLESFRVAKSSLSVKRKRANP